MTRKVYILIMACFIFLGTGCRKKQLLNDRAVSNIQAPSSLSDLQQILDNNIIMEAPGLGDVSGGDYFVTDDIWSTLNDKERNGYVWATDIYNGIGDIDDWNTPYKQVSYANLALEVLPTIRLTGNNRNEWNKIKGWALFVRANAFFNLSQIFIPAYDSSSARSDMGLPLPLKSAIQKSVRSSVQQTYDQIIADAKEAATLLPVAIEAGHPNHPSAMAAKALLAKIFLSMRAYNEAFIYADSCINTYNKLLDYNDVNASTPFPFSFSNPEILYFSRVSTSTTLLTMVAPGTFADSALYASYAANDLRRNTFFAVNGAGRAIIKGSYSSSIFQFAGLATDEVYLIRAECLARSENTTSAMNDLNMLLAKRWKKGFFTPLKAAGALDALQMILAERRKELPFRGVRWTDVRRLNKEQAGIVLTRKIRDKIYILGPNDLRYVLPIPPDVIALGNIPQNPR